MELRADNVPNFRELSMRLAYRLRNLRMERGLSQESVARQAGLALYTYQKYQIALVAPFTGAWIETSSATTS